jgi:hypothetical protein
MINHPHIATCSGTPEVRDESDLVTARTLHRLNSICLPRDKDKEWGRTNARAYGFSERLSFDGQYLMVGRKSSTSASILLLRPGSLSSLLVSLLNLCVKVPRVCVVDLLLILAAVASRDDRLPGRKSILWQRLVAGVKDIALKYLYKCIPLPLKGGKLTVHANSDSHWDELQHNLVELVPSDQRLLRDVEQLGDHVPGSFLSSIVRPYYDVPWPSGFELFTDRKASCEYYSSRTQAAGTLSSIAPTVKF